MLIKMAFDCTRFVLRNRTLIDCRSILTDHSKPSAVNHQSATSRGINRTGKKYEEKFHFCLERKLRI